MAVWIRNALLAWQDYSKPEGDMDAERIPLPLDQSTVFRNLARDGKVDTERAMEIAGLL